MSTLIYTIGDATRPIGEGPKIIAHVCNDRGSWGSGFVTALSARWELPERGYRKLASRPLVLGQVQVIPVEQDVWVANMIAQHGLRSATNPVPLKLPPLQEALSKLAIRAAAWGASVHMPRIGSGLAGGKWKDIEPIIQSTLCAAGIRVVVYNLP